MKYIIVGLGNFGFSLAEKLTQQGNEVIGIDNNMSRVENYKEVITHTICMDSTDEVTVSGLPLQQTDIVIIAIGEDQGANVMSTALFKSKNVKRLISRAINPLHERILDALGVDEIVRPEQESADRWARKLNVKDVVDSFDLSDDYSIVEVVAPQQYIGKRMEDIDIRAKYNLKVLTIIRKVEVHSDLGKTMTQKKVQGIVNPNTVIEDNDVLVLFGSNVDLDKFLNRQGK